MADPDLYWVLDAVLEGASARGDCTYVGGSSARGWSNPGSDVDVYVLGTDGDSAENVFTDGRPRVDVHALSTATLDRLFDGFSWDIISHNQEYVHTRSDREWLLFERLHHAYPLAGQDALARYQKRLAGTAYRHMLVQEHFSLADAYAEDCLGQLAIHDDDSAVLSGHTAHLHAIDGLLSARGCYAWNSKWRSRAMQEAKPDLLSYDEYWRVATMADLPELGKRTWAGTQVTGTRELIARVDVLDFSLMAADRAWERNPDAQVRLVAGKLALKLGDQAQTLEPPLIWVWRRFDGAAGTKQICAEAEPDQADEVRETIETLTAGGYITPTQPQA